VSLRVRASEWKILAARAAFAQVTVTRYGKTATVQAAVISCLWYPMFGPCTVQVMLIRDKSAAGYDLALVTTDTAASPAQVIERYAARWWGDRSGERRRPGTPPRPSPQPPT